MNLRLMQVIEANGHPNMLGTHKTTIEVTKDTSLTKKGDCIIGVGSNYSCSDLNTECKEALQAEKQFLVKIIVNQKEDTFQGFGSKELTLHHTHDMVFRKSDYVCDRTIMIRCTKAAWDIDRLIMKELKNPDSKIRMEIYLIYET